MRKIIQIAYTNKRAALVALCNDGTVWNHQDSKWEKYVDIPQDDYKDEKVLQKPVRGYSDADIGNY